MGQTQIIGGDHAIDLLTASITLESSGIEGWSVNALS